MIFFKWPAVWLLLALLTSHQVDAVIPPDQADLQTATGASTNAASLELVASDNFASCPCDLTGGACDPNCCCDTDCPAIVRDRWKLRPSVNCKEYYKMHQVVAFEDCKTEATRRKVSDLQDGLAYFGKVAGLMMCAAKTGKLEDTQTFVGPMATAANAAAFDALEADAAKDQAGQVYHAQTKPTKQWLDNYHGNTGYQPFEPIRGYISGTRNIIRPENMVSVQRPGVYGQCSDAGVLNFMRPSASSSCSFIPKANRQEFCQDDLSLENLFKMKIYKTGDPKGDTVGITIGEIKKYAYDYAGTYKEATLSKDDKTVIKNRGGKPEYATQLGVGTCTDFVLEYQLRIQYKPVPEAKTASFSIEKATLDLVYGSTRDVPGREPRIARVSSVDFYQTDASRKSSGTPGYRKEYPIRTASKVIKDTGKDYMEEPKYGMYFRGADNFGKCIELPALALGETYEKRFKPFVPEYTEDPLFTFEDSILYGCHLDMDFAELKKFCDEKGYERLLLFQYMKHSLSHLGRFGNSNPHFVSDWVEVSKEEDQNAQGTFEDDSGVCPGISSQLLLSIYYQKIGRADDHQHEIVNATMSWSNRYNQWKFDLPNKNHKQRFTAMLNVEFYLLDRGTDFFVPKTPALVEPVGLNFLYPFQKLEAGSSET